MRQGCGCRYAGGSTISRGAGLSIVEYKGFGGVRLSADLIGDEEDEDVRRCEYVSEDGIQCRNQARPGSRFCGVHDTDAFDDAEDLI